MNLLRAYRDTKGITQAQLANELKGVVPGIDAALISKMENGLCEPTVAALDHIAEKALASQSEAYEQMSMDNLPTSVEEVLKTRSGASVILKRIMEASVIHPVTREELSLLTKQGDREVRETIERLRRAGVRIGSSSSHYGYWLCTTPQAYAQLRAEYLRRALKLMRTVKAMDDAVPGQIEMTPDR